MDYTKLREEFYGGQLIDDLKASLEKMETDLKRYEREDYYIKKTIDARNHACRSDVVEPSTCVRNATKALEILSKVMEDLETSIKRTKDYIARLSE